MHAKPVKASLTRLDKYMYFFYIFNERGVTLVYAKRTLPVYFPLRGKKTFRHFFYFRYDVAGFFGRTEKSPYDFKSVMKTGVSVCEGYANVMEAMCKYGH